MQHCTNTCSSDNEKVAICEQNLTKYTIFFNHHLLCVDVLLQVDDRKHVLVEQILVLHLFCHLSEKVGNDLDLTADVFAHLYLYSKLTYPVSPVLPGLGQGGVHLEEQRLQAQSPEVGIPTRRGSS